MRFYTFGYGNRGKEEWRRFVNKVNAEDFFVFDVRLSPRAWCSFWSGNELSKAAWGCYRHIWEWGNRARPLIGVDDWEGGLAQFERKATTYDVPSVYGVPSAIVLLCCELDPGTLDDPKCHRMLIAKKLIEAGHEYLGELAIC